MNHSIDWMSKEERLIKERELAGGYWDYVKKHTALALMEYAANMAPGIFGMLAQRGIRAVMDELTEFSTTGTIHGPVCGEAVKTGSLHYDLAHAREMMGLRDQRNQETVHALAKAVADKDEQIEALEKAIENKERYIVALSEFEFYRMDPAVHRRVFQKRWVCQCGVHVVPNMIHWCGAAPDPAGVPSWQEEEGVKLIESTTPACLDAIDRHLLVVSATKIKFMDIPPSAEQEKHED